MERVAKAIKAVGDATEVKLSQMIVSKKKEAVEARDILFHVVATKYPKSVFALSVLFGTTAEHVREVSSVKKAEMHRDPELKALVRRIKRSMDGREDPKFKSASLGWTFTKVEDKRMLMACKAAVSFMSAFGNGLNPLRDGFPISRKHN